MSAQGLGVALRLWTVQLLLGSLLLLMQLQAPTLVTVDIQKHPMMMLNPTKSSGPE
jgi:hypothetical protein